MNGSSQGVASDPIVYSVPAAVHAKAEAWPAPAPHREKSANGIGGNGHTNSNGSRLTRSHLTNCGAPRPSLNEGRALQAEMARERGGNYDANGNLLNPPDNPYTMLYEAQSRPLSSAGGEQVFYDGLDRVTARGNDGHGVQAPDYQMPVYDGWSIVEYYDTVTGKQDLYVHGPFTDEILCKINGDNTRVYYQQDGLESAVALSDVTGNVTERYSYDIYGAPSFKDASGNVTQSSTANNRFLFTGREWLGSSNLYDYRTRIYSQKLGRFLQSDSVGFAAGDVNLYRYVSNSPLNYTDPTGQGYVDCGRAIARLLVSVGRLEKRLAEAAADVHCTGLDPEHEKAIRDAMTQVKDDLAVVAQHCGVLGEYAVIAALAALLGSEIALA